MPYVPSFASLSQGSISRLILFLALVSIISWIIVLATIIIRFYAQRHYRRLGFSLKEERE